MTKWIKRKLCDLSYWWYDVWDNWCGLIIILLVFGIASALLVGSANLITYKSCMNGANLMGLPYKYDLWAGCFIEVHPGQWLPASALRVIAP